MNGFAILFLPVIFLFGWNAGFAQNIHGTVTDSTGKAVAYANISLKNSSNLIIAYQGSNEKGQFLLPVPEGVDPKSLFVEASCIGFKTQTKPFIGFGPAYQFKLSVANNQLKTVTVRDNRPGLKTSGDTLSYKVSDFSSPQDRVIGDVIRKLPGIDVDDNGKIKYNGKAISNLYIGGDNLLDDKYNIATRSIPHGVVDQVQVMENHQPIKMLKNKVVSDDVALNLTFKKDTKLRLVGQETLGLGLPDKYYADLNAMAFKDQYKAINYLKANNYSLDLQQDLVSHNLSDYLKRLDNNKPDAILTLGTVGDPDLPRNRYLFNQSALLNLNNLVHLKQDVQLKVNLYELHDAQRQYYQKRTEVYLPQDTVRYSESQQNKLRPDLLHSQFTLNVNKEKYYLNNALVLDYNHQSSYSNFVANTSPVNQVLKNNPLDFSNEFNLMQILKFNHILEIYSYINRFAEPETRTIEPNFNNAVFNEGKLYSQLVQTVNVPSWFTNNYLSYKVPGEKITQGYKAGFTLQSQQLQSALNVVQNNQTVRAFADSSANQTHWLRKRIYAEASYDLPGDKLKASVNLPVSLQQIDYSDSLYHFNQSLTRLFFNPKISVTYKIATEKTINLNCNLRNEFGNIQDVYRGYILTNYRSLQANNANLTERQNSTFILNYSQRKAIVIFFFSVNASYNHITSNNIASSLINKNFQQLVLLPYKNSIDSWTLNANTSKYIFVLHTTISGGFLLQSNRSNQIQNNILLPYNTVLNNFTASTETKFSNQLNASYKVNYSRTKSSSSAAIPNTIVRQALQEAAVNYSPKNNLLFNFSGNYYLTIQNQNNHLKYFFADAFARYKFNKIRTDLELNFNNIFNIKQYSAVYLSANNYSFSSYQLPGRMMLLKATFTL
ncbi:MAG: carboxypeptidase regulatory-like domain-containing protein [Mucilaginibacter sp.]|uniref:carboxypeptidase regulatory-like domain-containing protein n=1 Tax=Mucilaginibacter sp. TaxID=1882438 RepID=UPI0034E3CFF2